MDQIKETWIGFFIGLSIYAVVVELIGLFFSGAVLSYTLGLLFGCAVAAGLMFHMTWTLNRALERSPEQAEKYVKRQSFFRLFLMMLALVAAILVEQMNFITVVLGMLGLKIGALMAPLFLKKLYPEHYVTQLPSDDDIA